MIKDLHEIQAEILKVLLFNNGTNFATLNTKKVDNNHFTFHLKKLVEEGHIEKRGKRYFLTITGKQEAGKLDTATLKFERQGKIGVSIGCKRQKDEKTEYLIQQRLKEPFYGWWGNISGKVPFGETTYQAAQRELKEEAGLTGNPIFLGVGHVLRGKSQEDIILDNYFFRYLFIEPTGDLISTPEGKNIWMTEVEIKKLDKKFHTFDKYFEIMKNEELVPFDEHFIKIDEI